MLTNSLYKSSPRTKFCSEHWGSSESSLQQGLYFIDWLITVNFIIKKLKVKEFTLLVRNSPSCWLFKTWRYLDAHCICFILGCSIFSNVIFNSLFLLDKRGNSLLLYFYKTLQGDVIILPSLDIDNHNHIYDDDTSKNVLSGPICRQGMATLHFGFYKD